MYLISLKYVNNIKKKIFLVLFFVVSLTSCSSLNFFDYKEETKSVKKNYLYKRITCPKTIIPSETAKHYDRYKSSKLLLKVTKLEIVCKNRLAGDGTSNTLNLNYKVFIQLAAKIKNNKGVTNIPNLYIAVVNSKTEKVLAKAISILNIDDIADNNIIINSNKVKLKHKTNYMDLNIYVGLQK